MFKAVFLGPLRDVEVEILYDNARYAITETCLALTIFREELTTRCVCVRGGCRVDSARWMRAVADHH